MNTKDITVIMLLYNTPSSVLNNFKNYKDYKVAILDQSNDFETKKIKKNFAKSYIL